MADPITITTAIITFATFIKDLIELGQDIQRSIEKISENRRHLRELTNDVLRTLADLANLTRGHEDAFQTPVLLRALGNLRDDMLYVLSICHEISPSERTPGLRGFKTQLKVWMKRDKVERAIKRLKEHMNRCYLRFTAFSAARIEQTSLRIEQTLIVNNVENQVKLKRLEGMIARLLLDTQFGQNVMNQTIEIVASDTKHQTLEFQFISVEATRLINSLQQLLRSGNIVLELPLGTSIGEQVAPIFVESTSSAHVLHDILGLILKINETPTRVRVESFEDIIFDLGAHLTVLGMASEAIAWELLAIQILRHFAGSRCSVAGVLPRLADSLNNLSLQYQSQLQFEHALQASRQSLDLWRYLSEMLPDADNRISLLTSMVLHAHHLHHQGHSTAAISIAQEAVVLCRPIIGHIIQAGFCWSREDKFEAVWSVKAFFTLATALSSVDRDLEAFETWREGFKLILGFSGSTYPPAETHIDSFLDQMCKVAEGGGFSLSTLADCVILFRDLARIYQEPFSSPFLRLLYAYTYLGKWRDFVTPLRFFLQPGSSSPQPLHEIPSNFTAYIQRFEACGGVIKDVIRAFYARPSQTTIPLWLRNVFITYFDQAIVVLHELVTNSCSSLPFDSFTLTWALSNILDVLPYVDTPKRSDLLGIMAKIVRHFGESSRDLRAGDLFSNTILQQASAELWSAGLLIEVLKLFDQAIKYFRGASNAGINADADQALYRSVQVRRIFLLCDMSRISEAVEIFKAMYPHPVVAGTEDDVDFLLPWLIQTRLLRRIGRDQEALQMLRRVLSEVARSPTHWAQDDHVFDLHFHILLAELAAAWGRVDRLENAVRTAERAVAMCRKEVESDDDEEQQKHALVQSLTVFSNCLAAVGRNEAALAAAKEATFIYAANGRQLWGSFLFTIRREELGANAFHSLSLRLVTAGELENALSNAEKAIDLYRKLVVLAPRHLPALASSLQNLALVLCKLGQVDKSVTACEEVVGIMRNVAESETYFLPDLVEALDQLACHLSEKGNLDGAIAATNESAKRRKEIALVPPRTDFLFSGIEIEEPEDILKNTVFLIEVGKVLDVPTGIPDKTPETPAQKSIPARGEENTAPDQVICRSDSSNDRAFLAAPVELKVKMGSAPMDILWWILLGALSLGMAFAVMCSRK
ncbi:hypothetical protein FB451DRAFT_1369449 [Mycena latifolia]|nr:hypothetical protein FB451DRAFT_1369449 [Mycena latifolia]